MYSTLSSMRSLAILSLGCLALSLSSALNALQIEQGALANKRFFAILFPGDLSFYARHDRINSASLQTYQSGPYIVTEMVIDIAQSEALLRIYHTELLGTGDLNAHIPESTPSAMRPRVPDAVQKLIDQGRAEGEQAATGARVIKDYPTTTHAKTVEYRVANKTELLQFYERFIAALIAADSPADETDREATRLSLAGTRFTLK